MIDAWGEHMRPTQNNSRLWWSGNRLTPREKISINGGGHHRNATPGPYCWRVPGVKPSYNMDRSLDPTKGPGGANGSESSS